MPIAPYDLIVFDLDGTLADTREDIADSLNHALLSLDRAPLSLATVTQLIGDGARVLLERALGPSPPRSLVEAGLAGFLARYNERCLSKTRLYPAVSSTLQALAGKGLAVLTNKPRQPAERILSGLGIREHFGWVQCGDDAWPKKPDPAGLLALIALAGKERHEALFVGDSGVDLATGKNAGVDVAFVTYGFRPDARTGGGARHVLDRFDQLLPLLEQRPA